MPSSDVISSEKASQFPNPKETQLLTYLCSQTLRVFLSIKIRHTRPLSCNPPADRDYLIFLSAPAYDTSLRFCRERVNVGWRNRGRRMRGLKRHLPVSAANAREPTETPKRRPQGSTRRRVGTALIREGWLACSHLGQAGSFWAREEAGSERGRNPSSETHAGLETDRGKQSHQSSGWLWVQREAAGRKRRLYSVRTQPHHRAHFSPSHFTTFACPSCP